MSIAYFQLMPLENYINSIDGFRNVGGTATKTEPGMLPHIALNIKCAKLSSGKG